MRVEGNAFTLKLIQLQSISGSSKSELGNSKYYLHLFLIQKVQLEVDQANATITKVFPNNA